MSDDDFYDECGLDGGRKTHLALSARDHMEWVSQETGLAVEAFDIVKGKPHGTGGAAHAADTGGCAPMVVAGLLLLLSASMGRC